MIIRVRKMRTEPVERVILTDRFNRPFDPALHAVDDNGEPRTSPKGNLICLPKKD